MDKPTVVGFNPEARVHRRTQEAAMDAAYVRAVEFGERYWVIPDGEGGWYACPASDKREREDGL
jgi:hypothetical protein